VRPLTRPATKTVDLQALQGCVGVNWRRLASAMSEACQGRNTPSSRSESAHFLGSNSGMSADSYAIASALPCAVFRRPPSR
jgi:hypothetical protein